MRLGNRQFDRVTTVWFDDHVRRGPTQAGKHLVDNRHGILAPRIIRSKDNDVAACARRLAHQRTLGAITIAATAEHGNDPAASLADKRARHGDDISQGVIGVGVVHHYGKILAAIYGLKTAGDEVERRCALGYFL